MPYYNWFPGHGWFFCVEERSLVLDTRGVEGNINPKPVFGMPIPVALER